MVIDLGLDLIHNDNTKNTLFYGYFYNEIRMIYGFFNLSLKQKKALNIYNIKSLG